MVLKNKDNSLGIIKKHEISRAAVNSLGAVFEELSPEDITKYNISGGVRISKLEPGKLANASIKEGFIITSVDKKKVNGLQDIKDVLENKTGGVLIEGVYPNGIRAYYALGL